MKKKPKMMKVKGWAVYVKGEAWNGYMPANMFQFFETKIQAIQYKNLHRKLTGLDLVVLSCTISYSY